MPKAKQQEMIVTTKGGLLAAIECIRFCPYPTAITLVRKTGKTHYWFAAQAAELYSIFYDRITNRLKAHIRKIPAKELLS